MPSNEPLVDEARIAALRRAMPARAFDRSVAAFRSSIGRRAEEARAAISEGRWSDATRAAHSMTGVSGNFGAYRLAAASEALETLIADGGTAVAQEAAREAATELAAVAELTMTALTAALETGSDS